MSGTAPLLEAEGLSKSFGGVAAARGVSFALAPGEMLALIGPNGAGKSTTFNMVGGQLRPDAGRVRLSGEDVTGLPPRTLWRRGVGRTFQVAQAFASMSVAANVQMALVSRAGRALAPWTPFARLYRDEALSLLARVGMESLADRPVSDLAYGDVKRAELAVALASEPRLLLMDEPTAGMSAAEREAMMRLVASLARGPDRIGVLFTEHDMAAVFGHADRILVLVRGELVASGTPEQVRADPAVRRAYLGESGTRAAARAAARLAVAADA